MSPTPTGNKTNVQNKSGICWTLEGSKLPPNVPAIRLPKDVATNHNPIICPRYLFGDNLVILLNPTGLKNNSPIEWKK